MRLIKGLTRIIADLFLIVGFYGIYNGGDASQYFLIFLVLKEASR